MYVISPGMMAREVGGVVLPGCCWAAEAAEEAGGTLVEGGGPMTAALSPVCTESEEGSISSHASLLMMSCEGGGRSGWAP